MSALIPALIQMWLRGRGGGGGGGGGGGARKSPEEVSWDYMDKNARKALIGGGDDDDALKMIEQRIRRLRALRQDAQE